MPKREPEIKMGTTGCDRCHAERTWEDTEEELWKTDGRRGLGHTSHYMFVTVSFVPIFAKFESTVIA
jgi:hypothetical protein